MGLLPILLMLAAQQATPLAAPKPVTDADIAYEPSKSVLSLSAAMIRNPRARETVRFECLVQTHLGTAYSCLFLADKDEPPKTLEEFAERAKAQNGTAPAPAVAAAAIRIMATRLHTPPADKANDSIVPMLFKITVRGSEMAMLGAPQGVLESNNYDLEVGPEPDRLTAYYPAEALRASVTARMQATCRVMPDRSLVCRDAKQVAGAPALERGLLSSFEIATYQVLAPVRLAARTHDGKPVAGQDVVLRIRFEMPKN